MAYSSLNIFFFFFPNFYKDKIIRLCSGQAIKKFSYVKIEMSLVLWEYIGKMNEIKWNNQINILNYDILIYSHYIFLQG